MVITLEFCYFRIPVVKSSKTMIGTNPDFF